VDSGLWDCAQFLTERLSVIWDHHRQGELWLHKLVQNSPQVRNPSMITLIRAAIFDGTQQRCVSLLPCLAVWANFTEASLCLSCNIWVILSSYWAETPVIPGWYSGRYLGHSCYVVNNLSRVLVTDSVCQGIWIAQIHGTNWNTQLIIVLKLMSSVHMKWYMLININLEEDQHPALSLSVTLTALSLAPTPCKAGLS
jgi:hypothetical protein